MKKYRRLSKKQWAKLDPRKKKLILAKWRAGRVPAIWGTPRPENPQYLSEQTKTLKARNEFFVASALWKRLNGLWICVEASPKLEWMKKLDPGTAKLELARRGCSWEWL
jgi:hypothetical protein